jgi:conjugal transfer mating pair stabilization protein TraN
MKLTTLSMAIALAVCSPVTCAAESYPLGACSMVPGSKLCVDETPCKILSDGKQVCLAGAPLPAGALQVSQTCWKYNFNYACDGPVPVNSCTPYENNSACSVVGSVCVDHRPETGACLSWNFTYHCITQPAQTAPTLVCSGNLFDTSSMDPPPNNNNTFANAAVAMEIARQTQVYGKGGETEVFKGEAERCTKGYWGLKNCCNGTPGAKSNRSFLTTLAGSGVYSGIKYAGQHAVDYASPYVFDAMYSSGIFNDGLMTSIESAGNVITSSTGEAVATNFAANGVSIGAYGFTYGTGVFEAGSALPGTMDLSSSFGLSTGEGFISFNPYVFAAMLVIQYFQSVTACSEDEMMFQMHKGANLVVYVRDECSSRILGSCVERQEHYCSFNSVLAKIINVQGKAQLGLDFNDCSGLTIEQVSNLDFTTMDLSEFTGQVLEQANIGTPTNIKGSYTPIMENTTKGSDQNPGAGLAYPQPSAQPPTTTAPPAR